jgi:NodT family efflux transporter outer membrane factor (OMF) lipoprotein
MIGRRPRTPLALATAALLAACTVGPDYRAPTTTVPAGFGGPEGDAAVRQPVAEWWTTFGDPTLDSLVDRAVRANPDLRAAQARIRAARARRGVVAADALPSVDAGAGASRSRTSDHISDYPGSTSDLFQAGFDAVWELDVFGGVRREVEAADADLAASVEDRRDVLVTLLAEVARDYVELRASQRQREIARANLRTQRETLALTRERQVGGVATDLDVARAETQVAATESTIPGFESSERVAAHALAVLLGEPPNALLGELSADAPIPGRPTEVPVGLPSDLLVRRPDIRRAERRLAAATARIGAAESDYFPSFSLTGAFGLASDGLGDFVDSGSRTASGGAAVRWRVLDFGRIEGNVEIRTAAEEQAAAEYEATVLAGLREVEDALVLYAKERERRDALARAERASARAFSLANQLWSAGSTDFLSVLDAQRNLFLAQDALVQSDRRAALDLVALYKALGGGWETDTGPAADGGQGGPGTRTFDLSGSK